MELLAGRPVLVDFLGPLSAAGLVPLLDVLFNSSVEVDVGVADDLSEIGGLDAAQVRAVILVGLGSGHHVGLLHGILHDSTLGIEALPESTAGRALYFILGTGLRMAELAGLRWCDIHGNSFTVKQTIGRIRDFSDDAPTRTRLEASTPKTKAGRRTIPLSSKMQELLATQRVIQLETRLAQGPAWNAYDLVFCSDLGTPYEGRNLRRALHRTLKKAGLPQMGIHALRHPYVKLKTKLFYSSKSAIL